MKEQIWLSIKVPKGKWCYALARYEDGTIRVSENIDGGFSDVGNRIIDIEDNTKPVRLYPGEKRRIIEDLYRACEEYLKNNPDEK